jgi:hypothetical protein
MIVQLMMLFHVRFVQRSPSNSWSLSKSWRKIMADGRIPHADDDQLQRNMRNQHKWPTLSETRRPNASWYTAGRQMCYVARNFMALGGWG